MCTASFGEECMLHSSCRACDEDIQLIWLLSSVQSVKYCWDRLVPLPLMSPQSWSACWALSSLFLNLSFSIPLSLYICVLAGVRLARSASSSCTEVQTHTSMCRGSGSSSPSASLHALALSYPLCSRWRPDIVIPITTTHGALSDPVTPLGTLIAQQSTQVLVSPQMHQSHTDTGAAGWETREEDLERNSQLLWKTLQSCGLRGFEFVLGMSLERIFVEVFKGL